MFPWQEAQRRGAYPSKGQRASAARDADQPGAGSNARNVLKVSSTRPEPDVGYRVRIRPDRPRQGEYPVQFQHNWSKRSPRDAAGTERISGH